MAPPAVPPAGAGWAGSLDRVSSVSAPDGPSRVVADASGAAITGVSELRVVDSNGDERWSAWFGDQAVLGPVALSPTLAVVAVDEVTLAALARIDGTPQWEHPVADPWDVTIGNGPDGSTLVGTVSRAGVLEVLDGANGRPRWVTQLPLVGRVLLVNVRLAGARVVVAWSDSEASRIRAFDIETGQVAWSDDRASYTSMPAVTDDVVAFAVNDGRSGSSHRRRGRVHVIDLVTGVERWARDIRGIFVPSVATAASRRVLAVVDLLGTVTAIDMRTHEVRWRARTGRKQAEAEPRRRGAHDRDDDVRDRVAVARRARWSSGAER